MRILILPFSGCHLPNNPDLEVQAQGKTSGKSLLQHLPWESRTTRRETPFQLYPAPPRQKKRSPKKLNFQSHKAPNATSIPNLFSHIPACRGAQQNSTRHPFSASIQTGDSDLSAEDLSCHPVSSRFVGLGVFGVFCVCVCVLALLNPPNEIGCRFFNITMHCILFFPSPRVIRGFLNAQK